MTSKNPANAVLFSLRQLTVDAEHLPLIITQISNARRETFVCLGVVPNQIVDAHIEVIREFHQRVERRFTDLVFVFPNGRLTQSDRIGKLLLANPIGGS